MASVRMCKSRQDTIPIQDSTAQVCDVELVEGLGWKVLRELHGHQKDYIPGRALLLCHVSRS